MISPFVPLSALALLTASVSATPMPNGTLVQRDDSLPMLHAVWAHDEFSTTFAPGGNQQVVTSGFTLLNDAGDVIWKSSAPGGHTPCDQYGSTFSLYAECLGQTFTFACGSAFGGDPSNCAVWPGGTSDQPDDCQKGQGGTYTGGLYAGNKGVCVASFGFLGSCGANAPLQDANVPDVLPPCDGCGSC